MQLHPHYGRIYLLYDTPVWPAHLRPTGTAEASSKRLFCEVHAQPHGMVGLPFILELAAPEQSPAGGHLYRGGTDCAHTIQPYRLLQTAGRVTACSREHGRLLDISTADRTGSLRARAISSHMGQDAGLSSATGHRDRGCAEATLQQVWSQRAFSGISTRSGPSSTHATYPTNVHVHLRGRRGEAL